MFEHSLGNLASEGSATLHESGLNRLDSEESRRGDAHPDAAVFGFAYADALRLARVSRMALAPRFRGHVRSSGFKSDCPLDGPRPQ